MKALILFLALLLSPVLVVAPVALDLQGHASPAGLAGELSRPVLELAR